MPRQAGIISFIGKMGGISFYSRKGVLVARRGSGPSKSKIKNNPKFERTRQNISEFGVVSSAAAAFARVFAPVKEIRDGAIRHRAIRLFNRIIKMEEGVPGQRPLLISNKRRALVGFEINDSTPFTYVCDAKFTCSHSADRKEASIHISSISIRKHFGATHFRLIHVVGLLPDFGFCDKSKGYAPLSDKHALVSEVSFSPYIAWEQKEHGDISLTTSLANAANEHVTVVQALGISFFSETNNLYYPYQQGKAMQIVDVF